MPPSLKYAFMCKQFSMYSLLYESSTFLILIELHTLAFTNMKLHTNPGPNNNYKVVVPAEFQSTIKP